MKIKDYCNVDYAELLSQKIKAVYHDFQDDLFIKHIDKNLPDKEFSEHMDFFADAFELYLPENYEHNIKIFGSMLGP